MKPLDILLEMKVDSCFKHMVSYFSVAAGKSVFAAKPFVSKIRRHVPCDLEINARYELARNSCVIVIE